MKSQQFNKFFLPKTEKIVEKILIIDKKQVLTTRIIQSFLNEKVPNRCPYQDTTNTIYRRDGRNESQTAKFNSLQYIVCSFAK